MKSLGSSLAHGVAKREVRETHEAFNQALKKAYDKYINDNQSRSARYRNLCKLVDEVVGGHLLVKYVTGRNQRGTDKRAYCQWIYWIGRGQKVSNEKDLRIWIESTQVYARDPKLLSASFCEIGHHGLARIYQTYNCRSFGEFSQKYLSGKALLSLGDLGVEYIEGKRSAEMVTSMLLGDAEIKIGYSPKPDVPRHLKPSMGSLAAIHIKSALAFSAMAPDKARHLQNLQREAGEEIVVIPPLANR